MQLRASRSTFTFASAFALVLGAGAGSGCDGGDGAPAVPDAPIGDCAITPGERNPLDGIGTVEMVAGGFQFTEGPQWREAEADLVFTDIPANRIYRYAPNGGAPTVLVEPSGNANGLAVDGNGMLLAAEHSGRRISRAGVAVATMFEGKRFNSPNDLVVAPDGTIYFTDPPYGLQGPSEMGFMGVFRIAPDGTVFAEHRGAMSARPNGIGLGPAFSLYMADTADGNLYEHPINPATGALGPRRVLAATSGGPDGLAIDLGGNIFVTTATGVEVFSRSGARWGVIPVPQQPSNCAFGDADGRTLYITARTAVYRVRVAEAGRPCS